MQGAELILFLFRVVFGLSTLLAALVLFLVWRDIQKGRRLDAIEQRLGLVSKMQRSEGEQTQQVATKRPNSA